MLLSLLVAFTALTASGDAAPIAAAPPCGGEHPKGPVGGTYVCSFEDDFDGTTYDPSKWIGQDSTISGMTTLNQDCFVSSPDTISVSDGQAHLVARRTAAPFTCHSPYGDFTSQSEVGTLTTYNRWAQTYGWFEFRARFPATRATGVHSALWLTPNQLTYGAWPRSGEIDVAEWFSNHPTIAYPSVHYDGETFGYSSGATCTTATPEDFHRYAVAWTTTRMYFYLDGTMCWQYSWIPTSKLVGSEPFDQPFNIVLSQAFDGAPNATTPETPDVNTMDVDWVRAWSWTPPAGGVSSQPKPAVGTAIVRHHPHRRARS
ncbi:glycoside hydrolase family 16 protein [Nocardioides maradonensis]